MSITVPTVAGDSDDVEFAPPSWLPALLAAVPGTSAVLFDRDLTIRASGGPAWERAHLVMSPGRRLPDVLPADVLSVAGRHLAAPFEGRTSDFEYFSPRTEIEYHLTCRPVMAEDGTISAGLLVGREVTEDNRQRAVADEIQRLKRVCCAAYDRRQGWVADATLLALHEVSTVEQLLATLDRIVLPADEAAVRTAVADVLANGGRHTLRYRIRRTRSGDVRHAIGSVMGVLDEGGVLVRAMITLVDITPDVLDDQLAAQSARHRIRLLRRASDLLAQRFHTRRVRIQQIADLMATTLGSGTLIRVMTIGSSDDRVHLFTETVGGTPVSADLRAAVGPPLPWRASELPTLASVRLYSSLDGPQWPAMYRQQTGSSPDPAVTHFISAPIRHDGTVLGFVHAIRIHPVPFAHGDDDVLQVMSDRIGWVIAQERTKDLLGQECDKTTLLQDGIDRLQAEQRALLEQLSTVEERERLLLAEAIHDEPLQLVVAATMRLDALSGNLAAGPAETEQVVEILVDAVGKLRTLITALTPPELADGLGVALRRLAEAVFVVNPDVTVTVTGHDHVSLSSGRKLNVCRILREGLVNARKHARATHIWLSLQEADGRVIATLRDDGVGATDLDPRPGHLGMATMHGRAKAEDGELEVTTAPGEGTTLVLTVPIDVPPVARPDRIERS